MWRLRVMSPLVGGSNRARLGKKVMKEGDEDGEEEADEE